MKIGVVIGRFQIDEPRDVFKSPATASWKKSKKGRLALVQHEVFETVHGSKWATVPENRANSFGGDKLQTVFLDGYLVNPTTLREIRVRAAL